LQKSQNAIFFAIDNTHELYLRFIMLLRILFWFIVFYSIFKLLVRVVLPLLIKTTIRNKMKDIRENTPEFDVSGQSTTPPPEARTKSKTGTSKGDYIDFEEVK
jgi:hypothetical protein